MSIETGPPESAPAGLPELTDLGKRIEMLRIARGLSKQQLARGAGASRQQLWRVATGKSDLTPALRQRLADVLHVDSSELRPMPTASYDRRAAGSRAAGVAGSTSPGAESSADWPFVRRAAAAAPAALGEFIADPAAVARALAMLPPGRDGLPLKRALLDAIEDAALARALRLDAPFFDLRRRVLNGEL